MLFSTKAIWIKLCFKSTNIDASSLLMLRMLFSLPFYAVGVWGRVRPIPYLKPHPFLRVLNSSKLVKMP